MSVITAMTALLDAADSAQNGGLAESRTLLQAAVLYAEAELAETGELGTASACLLLRQIADEIIDPEGVP